MVNPIGLRRLFFLSHAFCASHRTLTRRAARRKNIAKVSGERFLFIGIRFTIVWGGGGVLEKLCVFSRSRLRRRRVCLTMFSALCLTPSNTEREHTQNSNMFFLRNVHTDAHRSRTSWNLTTTWCMMGGAQALSANAASGTLAKSRPIRMHWRVVGGSGGN